MRWTVQWHHTPEARERACWILKSFNKRASLGAAAVAVLVVPVPVKLQARLIPSRYPSIPFSSLVNTDSG